MSVIQNIREKYAKWAVVAIALALLGFILTDYFTAKNRSFGGESDNVGSVNGVKINYFNYESRLNAMEERAQEEARQQGREFTEEERYTNNEQLWNNQVEQIIMSEEYDKVGIAVGKKEFNDWLFGNNPPEDLRSRFSDQQGNYDGAAAQNAVNQLKRSTNQADKDQLDIFLTSLEYSRKAEKYNSLLSNAIYYPKWFVEKQNEEAALLAKAAYVKQPYTKISDSTVTISDAEIEEYVSKHKDQFKQEPSRSIAYVVFDASPTAKDSAEVKTQLSKLKEQFAAAEDPAVFLSRYGSTMDFFDGYNGKSAIQVPVKDSIFALSKGEVYGPYQDQNSYIMAKLIDQKSMPDSVKARHILIQTYNPQTQQFILDDSVAKKRIDSIELAIKNGARFDSLAVKFSNDQGSGAKGGLLSNPNNPATDYFTAGQMVKEFNDFCFEGNKGEKKVVKTVFGYHLIEILDQKNFQPHYKVAYFAKNIVASDETEQRVLEEASKFASESNSYKSFEENIKKSNGKLQKLDAGNIKPTDIQIAGISQFGSSRQLVRDVYKADKGDVLKPERVGDIRKGYKYIVAAVTDILKEGTQPAYIARPAVERLLKDKKKGEQIKKQIGNVTTLDAVAQALLDTITTVDSLRFSIRNNFGLEPAVVGAIFNPNNKGKVISEPVVGNSGVYVIRVDELTTTSVFTGDVKTQQAQLRQSARQMQGFYSNPQSIFRNLATIKDNRNNFY